jgi:hypothetical protein
MPLRISSRRCRNSSIEWSGPTQAAGPIHFDRLNDSQLIEVVPQSYVQNDLCSTERKQLVDQHQVISIITTAICELGPEEASQIAKCVIEALAEAGLEIGAHNEF